MSASHGGFLARDGARYSTNISEQHVTETAVMASELEQLPDLVALPKLASYPAWMRVKSRADGVDFLRHGMATL